MAEKLDVPIYIHPVDPPKEISEKYFQNNELVLSQSERSLFAGINACKLLKMNRSEGSVSNVSRSEIFKIKLKLRVGRFLISKLVK